MMKKTIETTQRRVNGVVYTEYLGKKGECRLPTGQTGF